MLISDIPPLMEAVHLLGHGGIDKLDYRLDIPVPSIGKYEVLIKVLAAGINNTDINTRIGWYSKTINSSTSEGSVDGFSHLDNSDGSWNGTPLVFPKIQGADICGMIVATGDGVSGTRIGERVIVRAMQSRYDEHLSPIADYDCITMGSEIDGGFAQYCCCLGVEAYCVRSDWSDVGLASIPCAYSTAENMVYKGQVMNRHRVLITGASGGVGSAAIQLCKLRGAHVIAIASKDKHQQVLDIGGDQVLDRNDNLMNELRRESIDIVLDVVGGEVFGDLLQLLRKGGTYVVSGAIASPIAELDLRTLYLKDLTFFGCTWQPKVVFENLVSYIENNQIRPLVAATYPLSEIKQAQLDFINKIHTGKLVLIPSL